MNSESSEAIARQISTLTSTQLQATNWQEGAFLLLAGPGSGKTRVLTSRIARILLESSDKAFRVLALTFTNRAADEMRERIEMLVPDMGRRLFVGTFHSFCSDVLRQHGVELGLKSDFRIYSDDSDRIEILKSAMRTDLGSASIDVLGNVKILPLLDRIRALLIEPADVIGHFRDRELGDAVGKAYGAYDRRLFEINAQDYPSLLLNAYRIFSRFPWLANRFRRTYRYWNIDEFQDTNIGQYTILRSLAGSEFENIFVVADDDQIIYQWNGASPKRLEEFTKDFSPEVLQLPTNFRCPRQIVEIANKLVRKNMLRSKNKKPLEWVERGEAAEKDVLTVLSFQDDESEAKGIAENISKMDRGDRGKSVVLARTRRLLEGVKTALRSKNIAARIVQRRDQFQTPQFVFLHNCLKQCNDRSDERVAKKVIETLNVLCKTDISVEDVVSEARATEGDLLRTLTRIIEEGEFSECAERVGKALRETLLTHIDYLEFIAFARDWFASTGLEDVEGGQPSELAEDSDAWKSLERDIKGALHGTGSLELFLQELELRSKEPPLREGEVALMTIHGAKGNEFSHVILMGLAEDVLPSFQSKQKGDTSPEMEEERRNCFVAVTRTKETLTLSFASQYRGWSKRPSRFLEEMGVLKDALKAS